MPRHAIGSEAATRRGRQYLRRATGRAAALLRERTRARAQRAAAALPRLRTEPLPAAAGRYPVSTVEVSGRRARPAAHRAARGVEQRALGAVSGLDLAAPAA